MAIKKEYVTMAKKILKLISNAHTYKEIEDTEDISKYMDSSIVYLLNKQSDGGYNSIFVNIFCMNATQKELWKSYLNSVRSKAFCNEYADQEITQIGWK